MSHADVDLRGFHYPLEPVQRRQQWQMDRLMAQLVRAQRRVLETERQIEQLGVLQCAQAIAAREALARRMDAAAHRRGLAYLAGLQARMEQLQRQHLDESQERDQLRRQCAAMQTRVDGLAQHREQVVEQYANDLRRQQSTEQDRDWLSRAGRGCRLEAQP